MPAGKARTGPQNGGQGGDLSAWAVPGEGGQRRPHGGLYQGNCKPVKGKLKGQTAKNGQQKSLEPLRFKAFPLAADEGFEPSQTESESGVLPLH